tara:strand:+ start:341 stop:871 length:531 start_codon:yes stop_codon:yes gene_type:complete
MIIKRKLIFLTIIFSSLFFLNLNAQNTTYFIDFKKVLNESKAGAEAQEVLKKKLETETKKFQKQESELRKQEQEIISQKKMLTNDEFKKKVEALRKKVADLRKKKQQTFTNISKTRSESKQRLLKAVKPIIRKYMEENQIKIVLDKGAVLLGESKLEITSQIIDILNKELKSLNIK